MDEGRVVEAVAFKWVVSDHYSSLGYEELACIHQILVTSGLHFGVLMRRECTVTNS
jgi:hypothetical protein